MAALADRKYVGAQFQNDMEIVRVTYDFAEDTGAVADYDVLEATGNCVVKLLHAHVKTAVTSGGSLVVDLGKAAGGAEFWSNKAVAALTLDSMHAVDAIAGTSGVELTEGEKVVLGLEAAAATAGKIEFVFAVMAR
ncbi:MAG: hypothetical protein E6R04_09630 [Spirochaetes bacterium]|nr:MAG: hypothetical protein E6R04_09630 [Spirochaetota bacterium]